MEAFPTLLHAVPLDIPWVLFFASDKAELCLFLCTRTLLDSNSCSNFPIRSSLNSKKVSCFKGSIPVLSLKKNYIEFLPETGKTTPGDI
jgi:hypothetical protein